MSIITLLSDYGSRGSKVSKAKALLLSEISTSIIVDVSHEISPFNIVEAAYITKRSYTNYPRNTIHIIDVDAQYNPEKSLIVSYFDNHYFITADNGFMSLLSKNLKPKKNIEITFNREENSSSIRTFVKAAAHIKRGGNINLLGNEIIDLRTFTHLNVKTHSNDTIIGHVIYVDNYGNVVSNITRDFFISFSNERKYEINAKNIKFNKIYDSFNDAINYNVKREYREEDGKKIALFNSSGNLTLCIYKSNPKISGGAGSLFGLNYGDSISIKFISS